MLMPIRFLFALIVCLIALLLPYKLRVLYFKIVSELVHLPFKVFGKLARWILKELQIKNPYE